MESMVSEEVSETANPHQTPPPPQPTPMDEIRQQLDEARQRAQQVERRARQAIIQQPLLAILIAVVLGFFLGRLLRR